MKFCMIGISYKEAEVEIRECASFRDSVKLEFFQALEAIGIQEVLFLATCNRSELYVICEDNLAIDFIKECFLQYSSMAVAPFLFMKEGNKALYYMFEVCAGFHSLALGEDQIAHQMKLAYEFSIESGMCKKRLHKVMQQCFLSVKVCKNKYQYNQYPTSIAYLAMKKVKAYTPLNGKTIMIVGSGTMAQSLLTYLKQETVKRILICTRQKSKLDTMVIESVEYIPFSERYAYVNQCDVLFSVTASPHCIFQVAEYPLLLHSQIIMDLASPRDVDINLQAQKRIRLYNLDDLQKLSDEHQKERKERIELAKPQLKKEALKVWEDMETMQMDQAMENMQKKSERIADETFTLLHKKLNLNAHETYIVQKILHSAFLRMVKEPMQLLHEFDKEDKEKAGELLRQLYESEDMK